MAKSRQPEPPVIQPIRLHKIQTEYGYDYEVQCPKCKQWAILPVDPTGKDGYRILDESVLWPYFVCMHQDLAGRYVCFFEEPVQLIEIGTT